MLTLTCSSCGVAGAPGTKFCSACGAPFPRVCRSCGALVGPAARFCVECGTLLQQPPEPSSLPQEEWRLVTVLFCDLAGSTPLAEQLDAEEMREILASYFEATG